MTPFKYMHGTEHGRCIYLTTWTGNDPTICHRPVWTSWFQRDLYRVLYWKIVSCSSTTYAIESLFHANQHFYVQKYVPCNKCSKISECVWTLAHPVWFLNTHGAADISPAWIKWLMTDCNDPSLHILKSHLREMKAESDRWTLSLSSF